jgi:hypothetical protein
MILPRQARDEHRGNSKTTCVLCREEAWELLIELLPTLFPEPAIGAPVPSKSHAFGAAVNSAYQVLRQLGGKVLAFSCGRPTVGKVRKRGSGPRLDQK